MFIRLAIMCLFLCFAGQLKAKESVIVLTEQNTISLRGPIISETVSITIDKIMKFEGDELYLYIDSPGGSVESGLQLIDAIRASQKKVVCIASTAASMAFSIFQVCTERIVMDSSIIMQHEGSFSVNGPIKNNMSVINFILEMIKSLNIQDAKRIGISLKEFEKKIANDWWMMGEKAVKEGAADRVALVRCSPEMTKKRESIDVSFLFMTFKVTFSGCPLANAPLDIRPAQEKFKNTDKYQEILNEIILLWNPRRFLLEHRQGADYINIK